MSAIGTLGHLTAINKFGPGFIISLGIIIEWVPKLIFYLYSGGIAQSLGFKKTLIISETTKTLSSFMIAVMSYFIIVSDINNARIFYLIAAIFLSIYQIASALTNVAYETEIFNEEKVSSYFKKVTYPGFMRAEIIPGIFFMPFFIFIANKPFHIFFIAFLAHFVALVFVMFYIKDPFRESPYKINKNNNNMLFYITYVAKDYNLRNLLLLGMLTTIISYNFWTLAPSIFHLNDLLNSQKTVVYAKSACLLFIFTWNYLFSNSIIKNRESLRNIIYISVVGFALFLLLISYYQKNIPDFSINYLVFCGILLAFYETPFRIWQRIKRQKSIPNQMRHQLTGIIISAESFGVIFGSFLLSFAHSNTLMFFLCVYAVFIVKLYIFSEKNKNICDK